MRICWPEVGRAKIKLEVCKLLIIPWLSLLDMAQSRDANIQVAWLRWTATSLTSHRFWSQVCHICFLEVSYPQHPCAPSNFDSGRTVTWSGCPISSPPSPASILFSKTAPSPTSESARVELEKYFFFAVIKSVEVRQKRPENASKWWRGGLKWHFFLLIDCVYVPLWKQQQRGWFLCSN